MNIKGSGFSDKTPSHVVGVGASAGGLEALQGLFDSMPATTGMAFVIVQHLSPNFKSLMPELLERHTAMPVVALVDDLRMERDTIYVLTSGLGVTVEGEWLRIAPRDAQLGQHMPINRLFESMAPLGPRAVCVVLSGTGSDGTEGARPVHAAHGLVLAQDPASARFDSMPNSLIESGCVDVVCGPGEIAKALQAFALDPVAGRRFKATAAALQEAAIGPYEPILTLLRKAYDLDFDLYKPGTIGRRIERFIQNGPTPATTEACAERLANNPNELDRLFGEVLIGVTRFFRDTEAFDALRSRAIEPLIEALSPTAELRVWVCACSTGEEAYSVAIMALEAFERIGRAPRLRVLASDVHAKSLQVASMGLFAAESLAVMPSALRQRYFVEQPSGLFKVCDELRRAVIFSTHNVLRDPAFARIDLVTCRNLLIYFQPAAQMRALASFHSALRSEGMLLLGESEGPGELESAFETVAREERLFRKRQGIQLPSEIRTALLPAVQPRITATALDQRASLRLNELLLQRYVPAGLLVNHNNQLLHVYGDAGRFLQAAPGQFKGELWSLLAAPLRTVVGMALRKAAQSRESVSFGDITHEVAGRTERLRLQVDPVLDSRLPQPMYMVRFIAAEAVADALPTGLQTSGSGMALEVEHLEAELQRAREALQHTVEELEAANEELQAGNEELMAANEELQSTNEELHAVNEELFSVNAEHEQKIQELRDTTADLNNLIHATDLAILFLDREVRLRMFTPAATALFPLKGTDIGRDLRDFAPRETDGELMADIDLVLVDSRAIERELSLADGRYLRRRLAPYQEGRERANGMVLTYIDVTAVVQLRAQVARNIVEEKLQQQGLFLQQVADSSPVMLGFWDGSLALRFANRSYAASLGRRVDELLGKPRSEVLLPEMLQNTEAKVQAVLRGLPQHFERQRKGPNGQPMVEMVEYTPHVVNGVVEGFFTTVADVTAVHDARQALEALFKATPSALLVVSNEGRVLKWNDDALQLLGRTANSLSGLPVEELVPPNLRERHARVREGFQAQPQRRAMGSGRLFPLLRGDGQAIQVDINLAPVRWEGQPATVVSLIQPSQQGMPRQGDEPGQVARRNFLANMSHEMRTPLNAILGMSQLLTLDSRDKKQRERLKSIEDASEHLLSIINDMLDVAKIEAGSITLEHDEFAIEEVVHRSMNLVADRARIKKLALDATIDPLLPPVLLGDARRLEQVLVNLLSNAVKFTPEGRVSVRVSGTAAAEKRWLLRLEVHDTGIGIAPEQQVRLFKPFQQLEDHDSRRFGGTGLGLSISRELARAMGGDCGLVSVPGQGSTFWFTALVDSVAVPSQPLVSAQPDARRNVRALCKGKRFLVVEDDAINRLLVCELIRATCGLACDIAEGGERGVEMAAAQPYDLILMDMQMPGVDGLEATRRIRALAAPHGSVPVVALTANVFPEDVHRCIEAGMNGHLAKPVGTDELFAMLEEWLGKPAPQT